jgi:hypothetical protein
MQTQSNRAIQCATLPALFAKLLAQKVTGKLVFTDLTGEVSFFFISGRFLLAINESGRCRRWYRAVDRYAPELKTAVLGISQSQVPWEYQLLCQELTQKKVSQQQARAILVAIAQEVLLPLLWQEQVTCHWLPMSLKTSLLAWIPFDKEILQPMQNLATQLLCQSPELANQLEAAPNGAALPLKPCRKERWLFCSNSMVGRASGI